MKNVIVPAQITTVEDKVAGNLSVQQLILLVFPLFVAGGVFALMPPSFGLVLYKICIVSVVALLCLASAVRIKGTLVVFWLVRLLKYAGRPRFYVYRRADPYMREIVPLRRNRRSSEHARSVVQVATPSPHQRLLEQYADKPELKLAFKKGGLYVSYAKEK